MKRHRYQTKGEVTPLSRGSKSFYNRNLSASPYASSTYAADQAENIKAIGREQEVERFAKDLFAKQRKPTVDKMQEYRDDPTNPLAYLPFSGEAMDAQSVGHHLDKGNYGEAAMYGAGFALPFVPGAAVKRFASPAINKLKSTVKPYVDNARGAISFHGDQIASRINRNILDPIGKTVKPYASAFKEHSSGIRHGAKELMSPDSRPFTEIFPITKTQRELVEGKQNAAFQEGIDFVDNWVYETDRKGLPGYTGRTMRGPVARRINNIGGKPTPISLRPDLPTSNPDWWDDDFNPFNFYTDRLVNSRRKFLKNSNLDDLDKEYIAANRNKVGGFNSIGTGESVTLRNRGLYYKPPQQIAEIGVHEKGHTFQNMISKDAPYGWSEKISTYSGDHGGYNIPNLTTELGEQIGSEMVEPVLGKYNWAGSPDELHSELMSSRFKLAQERKKNYGTSMQESIENLQNPRPEDLEWLLDDIDNSNHFWKEPSWWDYTNKSEILKKLPSVAAITGTGAALRSTRNNNEEMYKNGGTVKYQTKGTVESRARDRDGGETDPPTKRGIRRNTERPETRAESEFYRQFSIGRAKFSDQNFIEDPDKIEWKGQPETGRLYPDISGQYPEVDYKGDRHWNIKRFAYEPQIVGGYAGSHVYNTVDGGINPPQLPESTKDRKNLLLQDIYKYNLADPDMSRREAWRESKKFMRKEIDPLINSRYHKFNEMGVNLGRSDSTLDWFGNIQPYNKQGYSDDPEEQGMTNYRGDNRQISKREAFRGLKEFNRDFRQQSRKEARENARKELNEWENNRERTKESIEKDIQSNKINIAGKDSDLFQDVYGDSNWTKGDVRSLERLQKKVDRPRKRKTIKQINRYQEGGLPNYRDGGTVKYQTKGTVESRARDRFRDGGETDPPVKYISNPEEFKRREQSYNDSLTAYLESVDTFESLGPLQIPMASGTIPRFEDIPRHASTNPHRRHPEIYIPGQTTYDVYTGEKARTEGYSRHFPSGNVIAPQISLGGGASGHTPGSGASMGHDFYPKPKQPVAFRKKPAFSPNRISPRWSDDLAGYFRGGPGLKGAKLETVNTKLQPIQSNWRPKSVGYTSNTAAGYPMIQRGGGTGRVPKGAYWVPGKGYEYTKE